MEPTASRKRAAEVIGVARSMRDEELRELSRSVDRHVGHLGPRPAIIDHIGAAKEAGELAGRGPDIIRQSRDSLSAILEAAAQAANDRGRDVRRFRAEVDQYLAHEQDPDAVRRLRAAARRALGWRRERWVGPASLGTELAALAALTWDLAKSDSAYTPGMRGELIRPWLDVAPLPDALGDPRAS